MTFILYLQCWWQIVANCFWCDHKSCRRNCHSQNTLFCLSPWKLHPFAVIFGSVAKPVSLSSNTQSQTRLGDPRSSFSQPFLPHLFHRSLTRGCTITELAVLPRRARRGFISLCHSFKYLLYWSSKDFSLSPKNSMEEGGEETLDSNARTRIYKLISSNHVKAGNQNSWKDGKWETKNRVTWSRVRQRCWEQDSSEPSTFLSVWMGAAMSSQTGLDSSSAPASNSSSGKQMFKGQIREEEQTTELLCSLGFFPLFTQF